MWHTLKHLSNLFQVSVWHPRAAEPSLLSTTDSASEYSLALNSAALKYLTGRVTISFFKFTLWSLTLKEF